MTTSTQPHSTDGRPAAVVREKPILFSAPMVRALLAGRKTQTRRMVKNPGVCAVCFAAGVPHNSGDSGLGVFGSDPYLRIDYCEHVDRGGERIRCPYGEPGDRLWVRETFFEIPDGVFYRATDPTWDHERENTRVKWTPSIFMRRRQSRITLEVTDVRIERVQDISEADAEAEGVEAAPFCKAGRPTGMEHVEAYENLWGEINGAASWDANPFVWVVSFKVLA